MRRQDSLQSLCGYVVDRTQSVALRTRSNLLTELGLACEYARERKKRGKASRKDLAARSAGSMGTKDGSQASPRSGNGQSSDEPSPPDSQADVQRGTKRRRSSSHVARLPPPSQRPQSLTSVPQVGTAAGLQSTPVPYPAPTSHNGQSGMSTQTAMYADSSHHPIPRSTGHVAEARIPFGMGDFSSIDEYHRNVLHHSATTNGHTYLHEGAPVGNAMIQHHQQNIHPYNDGHYAAPSPQNHDPLASFRMGESPLSAGYLGASPNGRSPNWLPLPSPSRGLYTGIGPSPHTQVLRYPVLGPILPRTSSIIPVSLACDLLDLYFSSTSNAFMQPASPYILGFLLRKRSVLRQTDPRPCSLALLASMLWVGAQTSESSFLTSPPSQRGKICHQLLELTVSLLNPLIHTTGRSSAAYGVNSIINGVALGGFGMANPAAPHDTEGGSTGAAGALDDVATYVNLATVVSASEYKAASLRWWNAAWSLARELKLGRELPPNPEPPAHIDGNPDANDHHHHPNMHHPNIVTEEEREERRRIWWLLYIVDRHLALCYNRPLFLLDAECDGLLQPENDALWQSGEYYPPETHMDTSHFRRRGPPFECTGHSIFGYFLPLMTILGEIVDLNHARNHPRFGTLRSANDWGEQMSEINSQLEAYGRSLKVFESRFVVQTKDGEQGDGTSGSPSMQSTSTQSTRMTEAVLQTKIVVAYGTHLMHTLHILLNGKWDPISLLDDNDLWISSQSFISATGHAVSAAEAISDILEYDPDLSFMPFFFGIYLLQGSFLLLLIADKLQGEASPSVVKACETIVRAHEVCVVTLNTEYQVCTLLFNTTWIYTDIVSATFERSCARLLRRYAAECSRTLASSSRGAERCWLCIAGLEMAVGLLCEGTCGGSR